MIYSKFERDKEECLDGLEDFNTEVLEREKEKGVNKKYNTIQIKKSIPILLSDEAFNRKMKEYQTEKLTKKKDMELSGYSEQKMSKNASKKLININNKNDEDNGINNNSDVNLEKNSNKNLNNLNNDNNESLYSDIDNNNNGNEIKQMPELNNYEENKNIN